MASYAYPPNDAYPSPTANRRYLVRQKMFSVRDKFTIKDETGQGVFSVQSRMFSLGTKLVLQDMAGHDLIKFQQDFMHIHPTYMLLSARSEDPDRQLAILKRKFTLRSNKYEINSVYGPYSIQGDLYAHSFALVRNGIIAAAVSKQPFVLSDTFTVEISGAEDHAFILALIMVIDQTLYEKRN